jgi:hypothetical protein
MEAFMATTMRRQAEWRVTLRLATAGFAIWICGLSAMLVLG